MGTSSSPDTQAFSIGQDREGRTQGPLGADEHDPVGRTGSGQGGRRFPSCLDSDGNCPRHRGTPGMAVHTRDTRGRSGLVSAGRGSPSSGIPAGQEPHGIRKRPVPCSETKWPERGRCVGAQQGGWPFLPLDMALPSPAPIQPGGRRWKTPFPGWDPGHQGSTEASPALSLPGACSWAKPFMLGTTLGFQDCPSYSHRRKTQHCPTRAAW